MKKEKKTAAGYCRVKIGEQNEQTIEQQKYIISQYAEAYGYTVTEWYCDEAKSSTTNRPEFKRLMDDIENNRIQNLIVHKLDRFSRSIRDTLDCLSVLQEHHVAFMSVAEKIDDSPAGKLMTTIMLNMADYYTRQRAEAGAPAER